MDVKYSDSKQSDTNAYKVTFNRKANKVVYTHISGNLAIGVNPNMGREELLEAFRELEQLVYRAY